MLDTEPFVKFWFRFDMTINMPGSSLLEQKKYVTFFCLFVCMLFYGSPLIIRLLYFELLKRWGYKGI